MSETHNRLKLVLLKKSVEAQFMRKMLRNVSEKAFIKIKSVSGKVLCLSNFSMVCLSSLIYCLD